jgi:hypothetical protein
LTAMGAKADANRRDPPRRAGCAAPVGRKDYVGGVSEHELLALGAVLSPVVTLLAVWFTLGHQRAQAARDHLHRVQERSRQERLDAYVRFAAGLVESARDRPDLHAWVRDIRAAHARLWLFASDEVMHHANELKRVVEAMVEGDPPSSSEAQQASGDHEVAMVEAMRHDLGIEP